MRKRKGLRAQMRDWNHITREMKREAERHHTHTDDSGVFECPLGSACDMKNGQWEMANGF